jgi:hypothetical protein
MAQNSNRGFASMDREERRRISSMGGRASHGGRGNESWNEDYDDRDYDQGYEDDDYDTQSNYDEDYEDEDYGNTRGGYDSDYEDEDYDYEGSRGGRSQNRNGNSDSGRSNGNGNRGFASMGRDEVSRIASMGGRAAHESGHAHEWDSEEAREAGHRGGMSRGRQSNNSGRSSRDYDDDYGGGRSSGRGRSSRDYDEDYGGGRSHRGRSSSYDDNHGGGRSSGGRGFASMDRDEVRRIASMGGHAAHGGRSQNRGGGRDRSDENQGSRGGSHRGGSSSNSGNSNRGFASMSPEQRRRISAMGGHASHGGGRGGRGGNR